MALKTLNSKSSLNPTHHLAPRRLAILPPAKTRSTATYSCPHTPLHAATKPPLHLPSSYAITSHHMTSKCALFFLIHTHISCHAITGVPNGLLFSRRHFHIIAKLQTDSEVFSFSPSTCPHAPPHTITTPTSMLYLFHTPLQGYQPLTSQHTPSHTTSLPCSRLKAITRCFPRILHSTHARATPSLPLTQRHPLPSSSVTRPHHQYSPSPHAHTHAATPSAFPRFSLSLATRLTLRKTLPSHREMSDASLDKTKLYHADGDVLFLNLALPGGGVGRSIFPSKCRYCNCK
ncbi:hypothetical protein E2C01_068863 [Portunus trituberculatus]|uniref:Uncharacterized protein n=1 Tax=Portunus trituberculatus TaxID=210409 RepID=A0A5B7HX26_PORTR|nr:hypothetical protein [Portunus trituberculatus]